MWFDPVEFADLEQGCDESNTPPADERRFEVLKLAKRWKPKKKIN